jgi:hypothetical protein
MLVQTPVHASWRKQVELSCSILQRKVLTPNEVAALAAIRLRLAWYAELSHQHPTPLQWQVDRATLTPWFVKLEARRRALADAQLNGLEEAA